MNAKLDVVRGLELSPYRHSLVDSRDSCRLQTSLLLPALLKDGLRKVSAPSKSHRARDSRREAT